MQRDDEFAVLSAIDELSSFFRTSHSVDNYTARVPSLDSYDLPGQSLDPLFAGEPSTTGAVFPALSVPDDPASVPVVNDAFGIEVAPEEETYIRRKHRNVEDQRVSKAEHGNVVLNFPWLFTDCCLQKSALQLLQLLLSISSSQLRSNQKKCSV
jgi:hypothetical protein